MLQQQERQIENPFQYKMMNAKTQTHAPMGITGRGLPFLPLVLLLLFGSCGNQAAYQYRPSSEELNLKAVSKIEKAWVARHHYDHERRLLVPKVGASSGAPSRNTRRTEPSSFETGGKGTGRSRTWKPRLPLRFPYPARRKRRLLPPLLSDWTVPLSCRKQAPFPGPFLLLSFRNR